jgi:hypothetical protein
MVYCRGHAISGAHRIAKFPQCNRGIAHNAAHRPRTEEFRQKSSDADTQTMNQHSTFDPNRWTHRISVHAVYYKIACEQAERYHACETERAAMEASMEGWEEISEAARRLEHSYEQREQSAIIAITFSAMTIEAFLYDYAADRLGDGYVRKQLDRLNLMSKYLEYPRRVCGKSPDTSAAAYLSLARLVTLRNQLVHFKSRPFNINELDKASDFHSELNAHLRAGVDDAIETVDLVLTESGTLEGVGSLFAQRIKWSVGQV